MGKLICEGSLNDEDRSFCLNVKKVLSTCCFHLKSETEYRESSSNGIQSFAFLDEFH